VLQTGFSGHPFDDLDCVGGMLGDQGLRRGHLGGHFFQFVQALLELLARWGVFGAGGDQLHRVEPGLLV